MGKEIKMSNVFISESGKLIVGSIKTEIYQDIDHNMIDVVGKFETEKHAEYAAHAIKNHDRLAEENQRLREFCESLQLDVSNEIKLEQLLSELESHK